MLNQFSRTQLLIGADAIKKLSESRVAVFGIGGVGEYACEALVRSGVGHFDLIDDDKVCLTNLNRQLLATRKTVGKYKAEVLDYLLKEAKNNSQKAWYVRLDASHDKMELRGEDNNGKGEMVPVTVYLKRRR